MTKKYINLDSQESIFFDRELEATKSETYDIEYPELEARNILPVSMDVDPGAEFIRYEQYDQVGMAIVISSYNTALPRADVKGKEFISPIRSLGASYGYNIQEIRNAKYAGKPLERKKADAAKRAVRQKENDVFLFGDSAHKLNGFINHPNISTTTFPADGTGSSILWSTKTPLLILRDLNKLVNYIPENTKKVEAADSLVMPLTAFNFLKATPIGDNADKSIWTRFQQDHPEIKNVYTLTELETAGSGGTRRMLAYKKDKKKLTAEVPQDFEQLDVQPKGLEFEVPCHARNGGVIVYYPLSVAYADGF